MKKVIFTLIFAALSFYCYSQSTSINDCNTCPKNSIVNINAYVFTPKKKVSIIVIYPDGIVIRYSSNLTGLRVDENGNVFYQFTNTNVVGDYRVIICEEQGNQLVSRTYTDFIIIE